MFISAFGSILVGNGFMPLSFHISNFLLMWNYRIRRHWHHFTIIWHLIFLIDGYLSLGIWKANDMKSMQIHISYLQKKIKKGTSDGGWLGPPFGFGFSQPMGHVAELAFDLEPGSLKMCHAWIWTRSNSGRDQHSTTEPGTPPLSIPPKDLRFGLRV